MSRNYTLIHDSHHNVKNYVKTPIKAGKFNLGWLPGGDKSITTLRETTLPAIEAAIDLMDVDAIINVAVVLVIIVAIALVVLNVTPLRATVLKDFFEMDVLQTVFP